MLPNDKEHKPIYHTLPQRYNELFDSEIITPSGQLVEFWEVILAEWKDRAKGYSNYNSLDDFDSDQLDKLAPLFGFTGSYYDQTWTKQQKIDLFKLVYHDPYLWKHRGSKQVFDAVAKALDLDITLAPSSGFIVGVNKVGDVIGAASSDYTIYHQNIVKGTKDYENLIYLTGYFVTDTAIVFDPPIS